LATVKDVVNCGVAAFETGVAEVAEIVGAAVEVVATEAVATTAAFASDFCCVALSEFWTGLTWVWSPDWAAGVAVWE